MSLQQEINGMVRLSILRILFQDAGYSQNHEIMKTALDTTTAQTLTFEQVKNHFSWLEDQGVIETEIVGRYTLAKLTQKGLNVANGNEFVDGIDRLGPEDL